MKLQEFINTHQQRINQYIDKILPLATIQPTRLHQAIRYAVLNNGKRFRPILVYATALLTDVPLIVQDAIAAAAELIHSYSLVHDDLPALDNDDLRRGQPTCHKAFDEATAILVGDALQNLAFQVLANIESNDLPPKAQLSMIQILTRACDTTGMVGGQAIDIESCDKLLTEIEIEHMHRLKTGALIKACIEMVIAASHLSHDEQQALMLYADNIGLAFQIQDDILDVEGETQILGKNTGQDAKENKPTYPRIIGLNESKQKAKQLIDEACQALGNPSEHNLMLTEIAHYIIERSF